jgi:hypothetical protein
VWVWVSFILAETHPEPSSFQVSTKRSDWNIFIRKNDLTRCRLSLQF